jgi:membrane fusion protein (multidrug efflux system)
MSSSSTTLPASSLPATASAPASSGRTIATVVIALVVAVSGFFGVRHFLFVQAHEETDDAQVEGDVSPVLPRVPGYVAQVLVVDNQRVEAGQALVTLDPHELDLRVSSAAAAQRTAEAATRTAEAALANAVAAEAVAKANVVTAQITQAKAAADLVRDSNLFKNSAISASQLADTKAAADEAEARYLASRRQAEAAAAQIVSGRAQVDAAHAQVDQRKTDLEYAQLQRSYATVTAPIAGIVSHKDLEPGQFIQAGQTLLSIAADQGAWIVANFKETQIARMHDGQPVEFTLDSYPGVHFHGRVESIAGATGARFALLPPDNASGNFVKVTQRVPVRIAVDPSNRLVLRPGVSADVTVSVRE